MSETEFECESLTMLGCKARDFAKSLMLQEMMEGSDIKMCKKQCCIDCDESCGYHCGKARWIERQKRKDRVI